MHSTRRAEQIKLIEQQHTAALQQWLGALEAVQRLNLTNKMRYLEQLVAALEPRPGSSGKATASATRLYPKPSEVRQLVVIWQQSEPGMYRITGNLPGWKPVAVSCRLLDTITTGQALYDLLFSSANKEVWQHFLAGAAPGVRLELMIESSADAAVLALPWLYLHDGTCAVVPVYNLALYHRRSFLQTRPSEAADKQLRILFTSSRDVDTQDETLILRQLRQDFPLHITLREVPGVRPGSLIQLLLQAQRSGTPFHIWHHHSTVTDTASGYRLQMGGQSILLSDLQQITEAVELAVLWTEPASQMQRANYLSALARLPISSLLGVSRLGQAGTVTSFFEAFYRGSILHPVTEAFADAVQTLYHEQQPDDIWQDPILFATSNLSALLR